MTSDPVFLEQGEHTSAPSGGPTTLPAVPRFEALLPLEPNAGKSTDTLAGLACSRYGISAKESIERLADDLKRDESIPAVGVVDEKRRAVGVVRRVHLFNLLGQQYGRAIYQRKPVSEVTEAARVVRSDATVVAAAAELEGELRSQQDRYFLLVDPAGRFSGVASTRDILIHLSAMTQKDLALAELLHRRIVPMDGQGSGRRLEVLGFARMALGVGGDFYAWKKLDESSWVMAVCDVSGKGISASLLTAVLGGMFDAFDFRAGIKAFAERVNDYVYRSFQVERFITGVIVHVDEPSGALRVVDMGHSYLFACDHGKAYQLRVPGGSLPIGVAPDPAVEVYRGSLAPGALLVLLTDGVVEQPSPDGTEYSVRRLLEVVARSSRGSLGEIRDAIASDLDAHRGDAPQTDDHTFLLLRLR